MTEKLFTCSCGSTNFFKVIPSQYKESSIYNWNTFGLASYAGLSPVLICVKCSFIHIPPANFAGKSRLDVNVIAYGEMLKDVEEHNNRLSLAKDPNFDLLYKTVEELKTQLQSLSEKVCKCTPVKKRKIEDEKL